MAKLTRTFRGDFDTLLQRITDGILNASETATLEDQWDRGAPGNRCAVRIFERYSYTGSNRVSMSVTLFQEGQQIHLCAITSGGSQAMFWKINTWGEEAFLDTLTEVVDRL